MINNLDYSITSLGIFHISSFPSSKLNSGILNKEQYIKTDEKHVLIYTNMQKFLKPSLLTICDQYYIPVYLDGLGCLVNF